MRLNIKAINKIMDKKKIGVSELADLLDKKESWVYLMLQGEAGKTFAIAAQIARALDCEESQIIFYDGKK